MNAKWLRAGHEFFHSSHASTANLPRQCHDPVLGATFIFMDAQEAWHAACAATIFQFITSDKTKVYASAWHRIVKKEEKNQATTTI